MTELTDIFALPLADDGIEVERYFRPHPVTPKPQPVVATPVQNGIYQGVAYLPVKESNWDEFYEEWRRHNILTKEYQYNVFKGV